MITNNLPYICVAIGAGIGAYTGYKMAADVTPVGFNTINKFIHEDKKISQERIKSVTKYACAFGTIIGLVSGASVGIFNILGIRYFAIASKEFEGSKSNKWQVWLARRIAN